MGTAFEESRLKHLVQLARTDGRRGPALSFFQVEPTTEQDVWDRWLVNRPDLASKVRGLSCQYWAEHNRSQALLSSMNYACAIARCVYRRVPRPLPRLHDLGAQAAYWKHYYNTVHGAGKIENYRHHYLILKEREREYPI